jgi:ketosteroid isomerase-like protein
MARTRYDRTYPSPGAFGKESRMTFAETLDAHLRAIHDRDLPALVDTLPDDDELVLIMSNGRLVRTVHQFVELHRAWFQSSTWTLIPTPVRTIETPDLAVAVLHLDYRDKPTTGPPIREASLLTLTFARRAGRWVMVHDQNTPIKARVS